MAIGTNKLDPRSSVTSLVGNRAIAPGVDETCLIPIEQLSALLSPAAIRAVFSLKSEMDAALGYPENAGAEVHGDPVSARNGIYRKLGGVGVGYWNKISDLGSASIAASIASLGAAQAGLAAQADDLASELAAETQQRSQGVMALEHEMNTAVAALQAADAASVPYAEVANTCFRPGAPGQFFTASLDGNPAAMAPIAESAKVIGAHGPVAAITTGLLAPIGVLWIEPGRQYRVRYVVQRARNPTDPANDAVQLGLRWLSADYRGVSTTVIANIVDLEVSSGRQMYSFVLARTPADNVDVIVPSEAAGTRAFVHAYGDGVTHIEIIECKDLFDAVDWSPDVSQFGREITGLADQVDATSASLTALQAQIADILGRDERAALEILATSDDRVIAASAQPKTVIQRGDLTRPCGLFLSRDGALAGDRIRIARTGGGAFALNVYAATNKALTTGTWVDLVYDDGAWVAVASGSI